MIKIIQVCRIKRIAFKFSMMINWRVDKGKALTISISRNKKYNYQQINRKTKVKWIAVIKNF